MPKPILRSGVGFKRGNRSRAGYRHCRDSHTVVRTARVSPHACGRWLCTHRREQRHKDAYEQVLQRSKHVCIHRRCCEPIMSAVWRGEAAQTRLPRARSVPDQCSVHLRRLGDPLRTHSRQDVGNSEQHAHSGVTLGCGCIALQNAPSCFAGRTGLFETGSGQARDAAAQRTVNAPCRRPRRRAPPAQSVSLTPVRWEGRKDLEHTPQARAVFSRVVRHDWRALARESLWRRHAFVPAHVRAVAPPKHGERDDLGRSGHGIDGGPQLVQRQGKAARTTRGVAVRSASPRAPRNARTMDAMIVPYVAANDTCWRMRGHPPSPSRLPTFMKK